MSDDLTTPIPKLPEVVFAEVVKRLQVVWVFPPTTILLKQMELS